ncbi:Flagellin domain protein [uncultured delta proteobacterium]|uniref:Flagellin n=1 Tax=uncultured delta proteobacterium TaxID=34034 RepID=A0A212JX77_9DELT|nr:Flagellin domain protein [uncultured delta proteobacterium]
MALAINHNLAAMNASRNLGRSYDALATSVRRLSSGLRVGQASDDAAGLAIRELMRADVAALNQGVRNANDAISMLQTHDGALQVIDEKLIRLKELAEQAASGTYNSDQRLMIDSEFQAMKSEISRIATATDFNGIKLLCNDVANKFKITTGEGTPDIPPTPPEIVGATGTILNPDAVTTDATIAYTENNEWTINSLTGDAAFARWTYPTFAAGTGAEEIFKDVTMSFGYNRATNTWTMDQSTIDSLRARGVTYYWMDPNRGPSEAYFVIQAIGKGPGGTLVTAPLFWRAPTAADALTSNMHVSMTFTGSGSSSMTFTSGTAEYPNIAYLGNDLWDLDGDGSADVRTPYVAGGGSFSLRAGTQGGSGGAGTTEYVTRIHFGTANDSAEDYFDIQGWDCTAEGLGIDGIRVQTQDSAQHALVELNGAIVKKDAIRGYFGAMQNRLENTVSNLQIQAENLLAAESRISDVDVAYEMTAFVRNQILTQSAVSMLSQANSMPQMALRLLQGA